MDEKLADNKLSQAYSSLINKVVHYYSEPELKTFKQLRNGFIYFSVGLIIIYLAGTALQASLYQELAVLVGLVLAGLGFFITMLAYQRFLISRILRFFR